jgi:hypothetical protein
MRLLLDVHHSPVAATRLRTDGHDVLAAAEYSQLSMLADEDLLRFAGAENRALVTENAKDFDRIVRTWATTGETHGGVIFTSPRCFHRGRLSYPEDLITAFRTLLGDPPVDEHDWVHWLAYPVQSNDRDPR